MQKRVRKTTSSEERMTRLFVGLLMFATAAGLVGQITY
jgi:hypothetical protein